MGANWANTLRLYKDFAKERSGPWEVYAFEASPLIQPYVEKFVQFLNGKGPRPPLEVPPSGSTAEFAVYAKRYGCSWKWKQFFRRKHMSDEEMRKCMSNAFRKPLAKLKPDPRLLDTSLVHQRLAEATHPLRSSEHDRFTFIPAAVGATEGKMRLTAVNPQQMIRGGALVAGYESTKHGSTAINDTVDVPMVDVATWIMTSFSDSDFVFLKMDVEGAEFDTLNKLLDLKAAGRIKRLFWECHPSRGNCTTLSETWSRGSSVAPVHEGENGYRGFDSLSVPEVYFPVNPPDMPHRGQGPLTVVIGVSSILVCVCICFVVWRQSASEQYSKVHSAGGGDTVQEELERQDILAEVYGAADAGDGIDELSPEGKDPDIDRAWQAIQRECGSSDDEDVNKLLATEEYLEGEDFFLGKKLDSVGVSASDSSTVHDKPGALAGLMD